MTMKKVAITNQKGGVGKSTISAHLAFYLEELGHRVLVIDLDPQENCSKTLMMTGTTHDTGVVASSLFKDGPLPTLKAAEAGIYV
ncbi:ParA family protein, partial [Acinetobacter baumannii]